MAVKLKIKKGDTVQVIAGNDRGKKGEVLQVLPKTMQVVVAGCKIVKKTAKPTDDNKDGGFSDREMPIHISNVKKVEG